MTCEFCGKELTEETAVHFDNVVMCKSCMEQQTVTCSDCGAVIWLENAEGDADTILCGDCYEHYTHCEECGRLITHDMALYHYDYPYCYDCYQKIEDNAIKNYNYKPEPIFYGSGNLFMGVELEIDKGGEYDENAQVLLDMANEDETRIYCKHDGSINNGFEIVSHPMTLAYHRDKMNWSDLFEAAVAREYRSHQTQTCGLHIHVNRSAFGKTEEEQDTAIARVIYFVEHHWNELVMFSRRHSETLDRWAARYATISNTARETYQKAKDKRMGRYVAVNLENENTIEFRLFRGTLRYKTFLATLQLVDEICFLAARLTDKEMEEMSWSQFVSRILPSKNELIEYLKEKRLYVNEETPEGVDQ